MSELTGQATRARRRTALALLGAVAAVVAGAFAADVLAEPRAEAGPERVARPAPDAGAWYCPATAGEDERAVVSVAAAGEKPSTITLIRYPEGRPRADEPVEVPPGEQIEIPLEDGAAAKPVGIRWEGGPAAASWRVEEDGAAGASCVAAPSDTWHVGGMDTAEGASSTLHLFNPFTVDAVARVTFATPDGRVSLLLTDDVLVEAGSVRKLDLGEFQPEQPDLGVTVEVLTGRLVAQGEVKSGGEAGRALIPAAREPAREWSVPYARADGGSSSWLSVINPGEREAAVEVAVSEPRADTPGHPEVSVPAGGVVRIDLAELSEAEEFGVSVTSVNDMGVVVNRVTSLSTGGRRGLAASSATRPAERQVLAGGGTGGRQGLVSVYNPGAQEASVDIRAGTGTPEAWSQISVPANGWTSVSLTEAGADRPTIPVVVESSSPVVAGLRSHAPSGDLRLWSDAGVSAATWTGPETRLPVRRDPTLSNTPLTGDQPAEEVAPPPTDPGDVPSPDADEGGQPNGEG